MLVHAHYSYSIHRVTVCLYCFFFYEISVKNFRYISIWVMMFAPKFKFCYSTSKNQSLLSLPMFLVGNQYFFLLDNSSHFSLKTVTVEPKSWSRFFTLFLLTLPNNLFYLVDGAQYRISNKSLVVQYNINSMFSEEHTNFVVSIPQNVASLSTVSCLFLSATWLERELSDFTDLNFSGLFDTRRLLLDYFEEKQVWQTHITNDKNFSNTFYDVGIFF